MPTSVARVGLNLPQGNFLPEIWSRKLQAKFYKMTVFAEIANRDWEGEIKGKGSKVNIRVRPTVVVNNYEVNSDLSYQDLADNMIELPINQAKYYAFKVDDIDVAQSDIKIINEATFDAARQMAIAVDSDILSSVYASATTQHANTLILGTTDQTSLNWMIDVGNDLDALNVPDDNRWIVIPPKATAALLKSDLTNAALTHGQLSVVLNKGTTGAGLMLKNGYLGVIGRFKVYVSNNLPFDGTNYTCLAGTPDGLAFASQFVKTETIRLQNTFGDAVRGLNVFGFTASQPDALVAAPIH